VPHCGLAFLSSESVGSISTNSRGAPGRDHVPPNERPFNFGSNSSAETFLRHPARTESNCEGVTVIAGFSLVGIFKLCSTLHVHTPLPAAIES